MDAARARQVTHVRWTPTLAITGLLLSPLLILGIFGGSALGLGATTLTPGTTNHVQVVETDRGLGLMAGLVLTESPRILGIPTGSPEAPTGGWVVAHASDQTFDPGTVLGISDRFPFEDPNGGTWEAVEIDTPGGPVWAVQVDQVRQDDTLDGGYNWAVVVDWDEVPEDQDLTVTYFEELEL